MDKIIEVKLEKKLGTFFIKCPSCGNGNYGYRLEDAAVTGNVFQCSTCTTPLKIENGLAARQ